MTAPISTPAPVVSSLLRIGVLSVAFGSAFACSAILRPNDDVERCGTADDCSSTGDNRYVPLCKFDDENTGLDSTQVDKICVADFRSLGCNPTAYTGTSMTNGFLEAFEDRTCASVVCTDENLGKVGCPRVPGGGCDPGLEFDAELGACVDPDADEPIIPHPYLVANGLTGHHVKDQFCKSFFCDDSFVCNATTNNCTPCNPDAAFGQGGCGLVYSDGAPAKIYVLGDALEDACAGPDARANDPAVFGSCD